MESVGMLGSNVFYSPLRYPGGKKKLAKFIAKICIENKIDNHYIEPYAGGASVALHLLLEGIVSKITINDFDRSIYAFWHSVLRNTNKLCQLIENLDMTMDHWHAAKAVQKNKDKAPLLDLGFSTFFLNRANRSGILNAGVIGGLAQTGNYKMNCRFNKTDLIQKIRAIAKHKKNIFLYNLDAVKLIEKIQQESCNDKTIIYFDPPYYLKGQSLYTNHYKHEDHQQVSTLIQNIKDIRWVVSYDNVIEIKKMYDGCKKIEYFLLHTAHRAKEGQEVLFFSDNLIVDDCKNPAAKNQS